MQPVVWQLQDHTATLRTVGFYAQLDFAQTDRGLTRLVAGGKPWHAARLLGLAEPHSGSAVKKSPVIGYVRDDELTMAFETTEPPALRVDAQWRAIAPELGEKFIAAVDLLVSVQTQLSDAQPVLAVQSTLPTWESLCLTAMNPIRYQPLPHTADVPATLGPDNSLGCLLFRQAGLNVSYVEMVHPADFCHDELLQSGLARNESCLTHRLFPTLLEKGVMLRAWLRGMFVPRIDDTHIAAECYAAFAAAEPPLGT